MVRNGEEYSVAARHEASRIAIQAQCSQARRELESVTDRRAVVADIQAFVDARLRAQHAEEADALQLAREARDAHQSATTSDVWPVEFRSRSYVRDELEAQVKSLLSTARSSQTIAAQLSQLQQHLQAAQASLTIEQDYGEVRLRAMRALSPLEREATRQQPHDEYGGGAQFPRPDAQ
jgi:hypothetical protein